MAGQRDRRLAQRQGQNVNVMGGDVVHVVGSADNVYASHHLGGGSSWRSTIGGWSRFGGEVAICENSSARKTRNRIIYRIIMS
jgi:hypothetical protein